MSPASSALARRAFADARGRLIGFGLLFGIGAAMQAVAYPDSYPTIADRQEFARTIADTAGVKLLYGVPHDLLTTGGYLAWRLGGTLTILAAVFGVLAAVRALRGEEDAGRAELVLAAPVRRRTAFGAAMTGVAGQLAVLWLALLLGILPAGEGLGQSAYLALGVVAVAALFAGVGAVAAQLAPTRRTATMLGTGLMALALLVRMVADTASGADWLRWASPLGWAEELRAFADPQPLVLVLFAVPTAALVALAARIAARRDIGTGVLALADTAEADTTLLRSPLTLAVRLQRGGFAAWLIGIGVFALIFGAIADSVSSAVSDSLSEQLAKLGTSAVTPEGFLGFAFEFYILAVCLFACFELAAVRAEEADQQLETLLSLRVGRVRWLCERLALVAVAALALALSAGVLSWAPAAIQGADVSLGRLLLAALNCMPVTLLFLALGALAFAAAPRGTATIAYGLVSAAFMLEVVGALAGAPEWLLGLSPFHHVALVPAESFDAVSALVMLALAGVIGAAAVRAFSRRDLVAV